MLKSMQKLGGFLANIGVPFPWNWITNKFLKNELILTNFRRLAIYGCVRFIFLKFFFNFFLFEII